MLKKIIIIILVIFLAIISIGALLMTYEYKKADGELQILVLLVDTNQSSAGGVGEVVMAFVVPMVNYDAINITPIYPDGLYHPHATAPSQGQEPSSGTKLSLNDTLLSNGIQNGTKLAQETVEYNTRMKTNAVVIMTPTAVKAMIKAVDPLYAERLGYVNSSSLDILLNKQNLEETRGSSLKIVMRALMETYHDPLKRPALLQAVAHQYLIGNIIPIPQKLFLQLGIASVTNKLV